MKRYILQHLNKKNIFKKTKQDLNPSWVISHRDRSFLLLICAFFSSFSIFPDHFFLLPVPFGIMTGSGVSVSMNKRTPTPPKKKKKPLSSSAPPSSSSSSSYLPNNTKRHLIHRQLHPSSIRCRSIHRVIPCKDGGSGSPYRRDWRGPQRYAVFAGLASPGIGTDGVGPGETTRGALIEGRRTAPAGGRSAVICRIREHGRCGTAATLSGTDGRTWDARGWVLVVRARSQDATHPRRR